MSEELWRVYDRIAEEFRAHAEDGAYNAHYDRPAVLELLGDVAGRRVLDAACGPGLYAEELLSRGAEVVGFDASAPMVELARARVGDRARIDVARLDEPLPYPDGDIDLVVCALAVHHVPDRRAVFAELRRVLRPGGAAVVSTSHPTTDWLRKGGSYFDRALETDTWSLPSGRHEVRSWREPLSDLCGAATDAGFVIQRLVEPRPPESMRRRWPEEHAELSRRPGFLALRLLALPRGAGGSQSRVSSQLVSSAAPASPLFSGWNWVADSGPFSTPATNRSPCSAQVTAGGVSRPVTPGSASGNSRTP